MSLTDLIYRFDYFKSKHLKHLANKLTPTDIAIDCGANVGSVTELLARNGATVYAFEPNRFAYEELKRRFSLAENVTCLQQGVWDRNSSMKLFYHTSSDEDEVLWSTGSSILDFKGNVSTDKYDEVEIIDLIHFIEQLNKPIRILKIDIEGAECELLEKFIEHKLHTVVDFTFVETHDHKIPELLDKTNRIRRLIREQRIKNIDLNWI